MIPHRSRLLRIARGAWFALIWLCAAVPGPCAGGSEPDSIRWRDDYAAAVDEAKTAGRLVWIQFTGPWCPNCTRMERDSFAAPPIVQHAAETFVPLKLRSDVHEQLAHHFNLSALPASIVIAPTLEIVAVQQGYLGPAELDAFLNDAVARSGLARAKPATNIPGTARAIRRKPDEPKPKPEPNLALLGFCPVSLVRDRKLVRGEAEITVKREGQAYRFAAPALADEFRKSPDRFIPRNDGACPVSQVDGGKKVAGHPKWGVIYQDRLFLCASAEARHQFVKSPERYAAVDVAE